MGRPERDRDRRKNSPKRILIAAYEYAAGGDHTPREIQLYRMIQSYGIAAVTGRVLWAHEIYRMNAAMNIYNARTAKNDADNWVEWQKKNEHAAELLIYVEKLMTEQDNG